jgi:hypothetical protein
LARLIGGGISLLGDTLYIIGSHHNNILNNAAHPNEQKNTLPLLDKVFYRLVHQLLGTSRPLNLRTNQH